jgi:hypothetical protein
VTSRRCCLRAAASAALLLAARAVPAADPSSFSDAERLLFTEDHFKTLSSAAKLEYEYRRTGSLGGNAKDRAVVTVSARNRSGGRDVSVDFLSGPRRMELPAVKDAEGNPLLLYFLEREVREMNRLTGGSTNYYRKRIRITLAENAQLKPVSLTVDGKDVRATEVRFAPYREDPARSRYEKFAEKTFVMTFSDQVPGGIVEMRTELLEPVPGGTPALVLGESLKYIGRRP